MNEIVASIDANGASLMGIFHQAKASSSASKPAILLWNVGVSNRIGPQRHYVEMARSLCQIGFDVLRFDLGGLGDSLASDRGRSRQDQEVIEIRAAMDHIATHYGHTKFVLIGFCSSASNAHPAMVIDHRVRGAVLIDGYGYKTLKFSILHVARRLFSPRHWASRIKRIGAKYLAPKAQNPGFFFDFPEQSQVERELIAVSKRGTQLLFMYSGGIQSYYNYANQFWDMFPQLKEHRANIRVVYDQTTNHLFMYQKNKHMLLSTITHWLVETCAHGPATREPLS